MIDYSQVTDPQARYFLEEFFTNREINREIYQRIPEKKFDFRMAERRKRKSDSPRESLAHQINVQRIYMKAVGTGRLKFGADYDLRLQKKSKRKLLIELEKADKQLVTILADKKNLSKKIIVPWNQNGVGVIDMFWGLNSHEILHTGWNLALIDHLDIKRFPALKKRWGR